MANYDMDVSSVDLLFKTVFDKLSENLMNSENVLLAKIKKRKDFTGASIKTTMPTAFQGGVGCGSLPTSNDKNYIQATISPKKVYGKMGIDRESIYASKDNKGAFVELIKEAVKNTVEAYSRFQNLMLFGDGTGSLGTMDGTNTGSDPYTITISDATWVEANWNIGDLVNVGTGSDLFEVTDVTASSKQIELTRFSGSQTIGASDTDVIYMQGSKDNAPEGLASTVGTASGTIYNINLANESAFRSVREDANSAEISPELINKVMLNSQRKCGKYVDLILMSHTQYLKIINQFEDLKRVKISPRDGKLKGVVGFEGLEVVSLMGNAVIAIDRFCPDDQIFGINSDHIEMIMRPGFGWFKDDGTVLLREANSDSYEARYGGYYQVFIKPCYHWQIHNLAT